MTRCGRICYQRRKINLSQVFAGQKVGVKQTADHIWLVSFMEYDLGYFRPGDRVPTDTIYLPLTGVGPPLHGKRY